MVVTAPFYYIKIINKVVLYKVVAKQKRFSKYFSAQIRWHSFIQSANQHNYNTTLFTESQKVNNDFTNIFLFTMLYFSQHSPCKK